MTGKLERWFAAKGYGFIRVGQRELFMHVSALDLDTNEDELAPGVALEFDVMDGAKGKQAVNVRIDAKDAFKTRQMAAQTKAARRKQDREGR